MTTEQIGRRSFLALMGAGLLGSSTILTRAPSARASPAGAPVRELRRVPRPTEIDLGPLGRRPMWTYDEKLPGAAIRPIPSRSAGASASGSGCAT